MIIPIPGPARRCFRCGKLGATVSPDHQALYAMWFHEGCSPRAVVRAKRVVPSADTRVEFVAEPRVGDRVRIGEAFARTRNSDPRGFALAKPDSLTGLDGVVTAAPTGIGGDRTARVRLDDGRELLVRAYRARRIP